MADLVTKQGDSGAVLSATITDASGAAVNLTGASSVTFVMRALTGYSPVTNLTATVVTAATGAVSYTFTATDTANAGQYMAEFHAVLSGGSRVSAPNDGYYEITIEENLVTPGGSRLVGLGEVKDYLDIPSTDRTHDAELLRFIDAMTPVVEQITGPVLQRIYQNEAYQGGSCLISLRHRPVLEVHQVNEYRGPVVYPLTQIQSTDQGTIYSYMFEAPDLIVRRTVGGGMTTYPPGQGSVLVTYTSGYAVTPSNIRMGTLELIRVNYQKTQQGGRPAFGGGISATDDNIAGTVAMGFFIPNRVRELLAPNKRAPRIA